MVAQAISIVESPWEGSALTNERVEQGKTYVLLRDQYLPSSLVADINSQTITATVRGIKIGGENTIEATGKISVFSHGSQNNVKVLGGHVIKVVDDKGKSTLIENTHGDLEFTINNIAKSQARPAAKQQETNAKNEAAKAEAKRAKAEKLAAKKESKAKEKKAKTK